MGMAAAAAEKVRAARLSIFSNTILVLAKLSIGLSIGSVAVVSEAVHSATDLMASVIAYFAVRASDAPPDARHPYGHGKLESLSGMVEALLIFGAGVYIVIEAVGAVLNRHATADVGWGIVVMLISAGINSLIARHLFRVAHMTDSIALAADAHHLSIDVWTSVGVVVGLALVHFTHMPIFDPLVAIVVAVFIFQTSWRILKEACAPLLDERLPEEEIRAVEAVMTRNVQVLSWHKLRTRKAGSQRHVDVHIQVDDDMSLRDAHQLTEELEDEMRATLPNLNVVIHTEPFEEEMRHHEENPH